MKYAAIAYFMRIKYAIAAYFPDLISFFEIYLINMVFADYEISTENCGQKYAQICV